MTLSSLGWLGRSARPASLRPRPTFRPNLDVLEDRTVPAQVSLPLSVDNLHSVAGALVGDVLLAGQQAGTLTISSASTQAAGAGSPILNLHIDPLHLQLLGLHVDTSSICLDIASSGKGLLGGLTSGLTDLTSIINQLGGQLNNFLGRVDNLLDNVLARSMTVTGVLGQNVGGTADDDVVCTGEKEILDLSLGPVNLNLLGLKVSLDDCNKGPVEVCVSATPSEGLLGSVLGGLAGGLNTNVGNLGQLVNRFDHLIDSLGNLAGHIGDLTDELGNLTQVGQRLADQLEKLVDKIDNAHDLNQLTHFIDRVDHVLDRLDHLLGKLA